MNILQIGTTDKRGGAAAVSWQIRQAIKDRGWISSMFVADKHSSDSDVFVVPRSFWARFASFALASDDFFKTDWILKTPAYKAADVVHCHNLHGRYFSLKTLEKIAREKPVIWTLHDEWAITPHCAYTFEGDKIVDGFFQCQSKETPPRILWHNERYLAWRKRLIYQRTSMTIVTPSQWLRDRVRRSTLGNKRMELIYNGIDEKIFSPQDRETARRTLGLPLEKRLVLVLADGGTGNPWKGWEYAKKVAMAYAHDSGVLFLSVGNSTEKQEGNIRYLGLVQDPKLLAKYYAAADVLLYTSMADNFPLVILEAMACGLPVVSFDVGGVKEAVFDGQQGFIAKYLDTNDLIKKLNQLFNLSGTEIQKIKASCRERVLSNFTLSEMVNKYFGLYQDVLEKFYKN